MLDHRVYRAAFLPAIVAFFVVAFSLGDGPRPVTTRVAPDAFDIDRVLGTGAEPAPDSLRGMVARFPRRRPLEAGAAGGPLSALVQRTLGDTGFGPTRRIEIDADTIDGPTSVDAVIAERKGLVGRRVVVVAHRDARGAPAAAELSGTAVLLEMARIFADRDVTRTVVLASVSGGSGGYEGAREVARRLRDVEAVIVLGDLASQRVRRPWVIPWSTSGAPAPHGLRRTVEAAMFAETGAPAGATRSVAQWARRVVPITVGEQGVMNEQGVPAVLLSATGETGPAAGAPILRDRLLAFGRGAVRAVTALESGGVTVTAAGESVAPPPPLPERGGMVLAGRLLPDWAVRVLVLALLLPALLASLDAFFRVRRRRLSGGHWLGWAALYGMPFLLAWAWLRVLDLVGGVNALPAAAPPGAVPLSTGPAIGMASAALVGLLAFLLLRPWVAQRLVPGGDPSAGGAAAGTGVLLSLLALGVWLFNPYAASVLLPAAHVWLLAAAPESRLRGAGPAAAAFAAGLFLPAVVVVYYLLALDLGPGEAGRLIFDLVGGGEVGFLDALALSLFAGAACATVRVLLSREREEPEAPPPPPAARTRGPATYAGPGSLGGTESALRR
jgi:hypothetical protein